jgi:hypothetical protein
LPRQRHLLSLSAPDGCVIWQPALAPPLVKLNQEKSTSVWWPLSSSSLSKMRAGFLAVLMVAVLIEFDFALTRRVARDTRDRC